MSLASHKYAAAALLIVLFFGLFFVGDGIASANTGGGGNQTTTTTSSSPTYSTTATSSTSSQVSVVSTSQGQTTSVTITGTQSSTTQTTVIGTQSTVVTTYTNTQPSGAVIGYVYPATFAGCGQTGFQIIVTQGCQVSVTVQLTSNVQITGAIDVQVRRDIQNWPDSTLTDLTSTVTLVAGTTTITAGPFTASDLSGSGGLLGVGTFREYYIKVSWNGNWIYDPTGVTTREYVRTTACVTSSCTAVTTTTTNPTVTSTYSQTTQVAQVTASPNPVQALSPVSITANLGPGYYCDWAYGDGSSSGVNSGCSVSHEYATAGSYTVQVTGYNGGTTTYTGQVVITVSASTTQPPAGTVPVTVSVTGNYGQYESAYVVFYQCASGASTCATGTQVNTLNVPISGLSSINLAPGNYYLTAKDGYGDIAYYPYTHQTDGGSTFSVANAMAISITIVNPHQGLSEVASNIPGLNFLTGINEILVGLAVIAGDIVGFGIIEAKD